MLLSHRPTSKLTNNLFDSSINVPFFDSIHFISRHHRFRAQTILCTIFSSADTLHYPSLPLNAPPHCRTPPPNTETRDWSYPASDRHTEESPFSTLQQFFAISFLSVDIIIFSLRVAATTMNRFRPFLIVKAPAGNCQTACNALSVRHSDCQIKMVNTIFNFAINMLHDNRSQLVHRFFTDRV